MSSGDFDHAAIDTLVGYVLSWTGYRPVPGHAAVVRRAMLAEQRRGATATELLHRAAEGDPLLMSALIQAVTVPETYFFRLPEQFRWLAHEGLARLGRRPLIRAWSAGCATGEEAYSLAACLLASVPAGTRVEVLGTDLLPRNVEIARAGTYGPWSHRGTDPAPYPVCLRTKDRRAHVLDVVRSVTRFEVHDLREPAPGEFDVIMCRNVLMYFAADVVERVCAHLVRALRPGGVAIFGTLDLTTVPEGLSAEGRPELSAYTRKPTPPPAVRASTRPPRRPSTVPPPASTHPTPANGVELHLRALASIDKGDWRRVERELHELSRLAPDYIPGLFERALSHARRGDATSAATLMRNVLERLEPLPDDLLLAGPEELPVDYYRVAARALLASLEEQANRPGEVQGTLHGEGKAS